MTPADRPLVESLRAAESRDGAGLANRPASLWRCALAPHGRAVDSYLIEGTSGPEGYLVLAHESMKRIEVVDWCATTGHAARQILATLAGHRSIVREVTWPGAPADPLGAHMPDKGWRVLEHDHWLTRLVDVEGALGARGYPAGLETALAFAVDDPLLPWNRDRFVLRVADGRGTVTRGGSGEVPTLTLDVQALTPLYTGHYAPSFLARAGRVEGPAAALAAAALIFAGPSPWMIDHF